MPCVLRKRQIEVIGLLLGEGGGASAGMLLLAAELPMVLPDSLDPDFEPPGSELSSI